MNRNDITARSLLALVLLAAASPQVMAQTAPKPSAAPTSDEQDETIELSPFTVTAVDDSDTYQVKDTLAGSRVRTELKDVASSLSVVNAKFMRDTGAKNQQDLLVYMTNAEVGGVYGNFAGVGGTFINGATESSSFLKPSQNTRVRGLDSADNTRDYFQTDIPWDGYIVDRVDFQRGPNSILFGIGSPAGIVNSSLNTAGYRTRGNVEARFGSFGTYRTSLDYNYVVLKNELSFRVAALNDETKYRQEPAFNHDHRLFGALRWDPKFLKSESAHTTLRVNYEHGKVTANRPRALPPQDRISTFFGSEFNKATYDPYQAWQWGYVPFSSSTRPAGVEPNYWLGQYPGPGIQATSNPMFFYQDVGASTPFLVRQASPTTYFGVNTTGVRDGGIDGFPYGSVVGIMGYNEYAKAKGLPSADKGFYKDITLTDTSIFDFYNNLIDGPNKREWQNWNAYNVALTQTFLNNRIAFEGVYDRQKYDDGQSRNLNNPYISVDVLKNLANYPWAYTDLVVANPNVGRAFVGSSAKNGGNSLNVSDRENIRLTGTGEFHFDDVLSKGKLTEILGRHVLTGLYSKETYTQETRNWVRYAVDSTWSDKIGNGPNDGANGGLGNGDRVIDWVTYLSGDLRSRNSAAGLNLQRIDAIQSPTGTATIPYYDSHWKATGVNPATVWFNPARNEASTESENPRNYVGWTTGSFRILNADNGDLSALTTDISHVKKVTTSKGVTLQSYLFQDILVGTVGWRTDRQTIDSDSAQYETKANGLGVFKSTPQGVAEDDSLSWGLVLHTPKSIKDKMPLGTNISLTYSSGRNTRVENRYGFDGAALPNAVGRTKDYGVVINTLDDRLHFKITRYVTKVSDANLSSVTTEASTLGNNTYYLRNLEAWGTGSALLDLAGRAGQAVGWEWYWNWALVDNNWDGVYNDPNGAAFQNADSTKKQTAAINSWLSQMLPQSWFDAYGFPVNVTKAKAGDFAGAIASWTPTSGIGGIQPSGGGRINGTWPTGTADNESKGWEFEVSGEPVKGLSLSANASKTMAAQTALGASLSSFIESSYKKYQSAAGDLRLWWGGDKTVRQYYTENIWAAYQFQLQTNGKMVGEMAPWRANGVANYYFGKGTLKGVNVGLAYRWQDGTILGYGLNDKKDNLDINRPYWGKSQDAWDVWAGYERKLSANLNWRVQLNIRSVGEKVRLTPYSVQPNGTPAGYRIQEGMTWQLTNTLSF
jgi:hypothetical protein